MVEFNFFEGIATLGFPAAVAGFVLVRLEHSIKHLREEISLNTRELALLQSAIVRSGGAECGQRISA